MIYERRSVPLKKFKQPYNSFFITVVIIIGIILLVSRLLSVRDTIIMCSVRNIF